MIIIKIMERDMIVTTTSRVTSGSVNLPVKFHFKGDEWDDLVKTAVFIGSGEERDVALITDECAVPADVLAEAGGDLKIGVYGRLANGATVIPTIWGRVQYIYEGTEMSEPSPHDPEPDWTAQVQQAAATALTKAQAVEAAAARGDFDGISPAVTISSITHGHSVTITDRDHPTGQSFNVMDGDSAYDQAVAGGYTGTEAQFNEELASFKELSDETKEAAPFYAEYGVTTKAEIQAAINGKRQIYLHHGNLGGIVAPYTGTFLYADIWGEGTGYGFALTNGNFQYVYELKSEWTYSIYDLTAPAQRAETAAAAAASSKTAAEDSATAAASSATAAAGSASDAATAKTAAEAAQTAAAASAADASDSADSAASSATAASGSATAAASSATAAGNAQTAAETAQGAAEDAQAAAEAVLASIPSDYTELTEDVSDLKSALSNQADRLDLVVTDGHTINLLDASAVTNGYRVNPSTGQVDLNYPTGFTTDFIEVNPGDGYCFTIPYNDARAMTSEINRYAFYDANKNFVSGGSNYVTSKNNVLIIPDGVAYGKFSAYMGSDYDKTSQWIENYKVMFICIPDGTVPTDLYLQPYAPYLSSPERILDSTLTKSGYAPDSKVVGDMLVPLANVMRLKPCYDHLFVNRGGNNVTIPHESVYHVRLSKSFGFDVIEANLYPTSDGVYIVNHTDGGKFGNYFHHVDGVTDISNMLVSSVTWDWIVANVRYNSLITKYRTRPCRLEEFLAECKQQNLIPVISATTAGAISIIDDYMGRTNYVAYNGNRSLSPSALIYHWKTNLTSKDDVLEYCESIGRPFIYGLGNPNAFTDAELKEIVDMLHANGYWIGTSYSDDNWNKLSQMGFDVIGATRSVNRIPSGNKYNIVSCFGFSGFDYTNATESDAVLTFSADGTLSPKVTSEAYEACMLDLEIVFDGELTVPQFGEHTSATTYTSNGSIPVFVTIPIVNGGLNIVVSVKSGTVITDCKFRASVL